MIDIRRVTDGWVVVELCTGLNESGAKFGTNIEELAHLKSVDGWNNASIEDLERMFTKLGKLVTVC
jgi:hypothetical protein